MEHHYKILHQFNMILNSLVPKSDKKINSSLLYQDIIQLTVLTIL